MVHRTADSHWSGKIMLLAVVVNIVYLCNLAPARDVIFASDFEAGALDDWSAVVGEILPTITITLPGGVTMDLNHIPAGTFWMGSPEGQRGHRVSEDLHEVTLTHGYYMGVTEVTQEQWEAVMGTPMPTSCGDHGIGPDYPVYCVSWNEIVGGFVNQLNAYLTSTGQPGAGLFRLPTEAEWERAARGGTQTEFSFAAPPDWDLHCGEFPEADLYMWWCGNNTPDDSKPVGSKLANPYGLHDMHGNLFEWVEDWWSYRLHYAPVTDPTGPATGTYRVIRSCTWNAYAETCRSPFRYADPPTVHFSAYGFRLARSE